MRIRTSEPRVKKAMALLLVPIFLVVLGFNNPILNAFSTDKNAKIYQGNATIIPESSTESIKGPLQDVQKDFNWEYATPESVGVSSEKIDSLIKLLEKKNTKKLLIIKNDKIISEWFAPGYEDSARQHYTASLSKALVGGMSLLVALSDKRIFPDEPACNYILPWKKDGKKQMITIRQLATHTSGLEDAEVSLAEQKKMKAQGLHKHMDLKGWKGHFWKKDHNPFSMQETARASVSFPAPDMNTAIPASAC